MKKDVIKQLHKYFSIIPLNSFDSDKPKAPRLFDWTRACKKKLSLDYCINFQKLSPVKNSALITTTWSIKSLTTFVYIKTPFICLFTCQIKYAFCPTCVVHLTKMFILHGFYFILANFIKNLTATC